MSIVVLLSHMDDEVFIYPYLHDLSQKNESIRIYFLTKSEGRGQRYKQEIRERESIKFLERLISKFEVVFLGRQLDVEDLYAHEKLQEIIDFISTEIKDKPKLVIAPNFEGGHIDHDTTCAVAYHLAKKFDTDFCTFNLYRAKYKRFPFYQVQSKSDLKNNSTKIKVGIRKLKFLFFIPFIYKSQWRTWIGIYPFMIIKQFLHRGVWLNFPGSINFYEKPNKGAILYANRGDGNFDDWSSKIKDLLR